jgi:hypothetical protein
MQWKALCNQYHVNANEAMQNLLQWDDEKMQNKLYRAWLNLIIIIREAIIKR